MKFLTKAIYNYYLSQRPDKIKENDLSFVGMDENGIRYYSWTEFDQIPKCRIGELQSFAMFDELKLSPDNLNQLIQAIQEILEKSLAEKDKKKVTKYHAQMFALLEEITWRAQYDTPIDILTNMAAILCVREDESPEKFSATIHDEKVEQFKQEERNGNFFFTTHELFKKLKPSLAMSGEGWTKHYRQEILRQAAQDERLRTILQGSASKKEKTQTTK